MADRVDIDPDGLDEYIHRLTDYLAATREGMGGMLSHNRNLVYSWRDAGYGVWVDEFLRAMMLIERGVEDLEAALPRLRERSARARELAEMR